MKLFDQVERYASTLAVADKICIHSIKIIMASRVVSGEMPRKWAHLEENYYQLLMYYNRSIISPSATLWQ